MLLVLVLLPTKKGLVVLYLSAGAPLLPLLSPLKVRALLLESLPLPPLLPKEMDGLSAVLLVVPPRPNDVASVPVAVLGVAALGAVETEALKLNEGEALNLNEGVGATEDLLSLQNTLAVVPVLVLAPKAGAL